MADIREIKDRINSIKDTQKVTDAMYMIASTKLRKARNEYESTKPYFEAVRHEIKRIFRIDYRLKNRYFYPTEGHTPLEPPYGYLVITSDKGLAGPYNMQVIREVEKQVLRRGGGKLYVMGEYGRKYFRQHGVEIEENFRHSTDNVDVERAREIARDLLRDYESGAIKKLYVVYTDLKSSVYQMASFDRLLPFHRADFADDPDEVITASEEFEFFPSIEKVLESMIESYLTGYIYSALIDSYCCEQNSRMNAMDEANKNANEILTDLSRQYNHARQGKITQEITEISAGAQALRRKNAKLAARSHQK